MTASNPALPADASPAEEPNVLISSYAASPAHAVWDPALEGELLRGLCSLPGVAGLEVPWLGAVHPHDPDWFFSNVPSGTRLSITPLPFVMQRCASDPRYGIASPDAAGRAAAVDDLRRLAGDVRELQRRSGAEVALVSLHTAPRGGGDPWGLIRSLTEISAVDWGGARLVIEHCDAHVAEQPFEKGFLLLDEEIAAIADSGVPVGVWLNWGRSAIELRDADAVTPQIAAASGTGRLTGLTFSGASATDGPYGDAWTDAHLPLHDAHPESHSLLDADHLHAALEAASDVPWLGLKVSRHPGDRTAEDVLRTVSANLRLVESARDRELQYPR